VGYNGRGEGTGWCAAVTVAGVVGRGGFNSGGERGREGVCRVIAATSAHYSAGTNGSGGRSRRLWTILTDPEWETTEGKPTLRTGRKNNPPPPTHPPLGGTDSRGLRLSAFGERGLYLNGG
jgi:hypothetical protein